MARQPAAAALKQPARSGFETLARFGYAARATVYATIAFLALQLAIGHGGEAAGPRDALVELARKPFGGAMLVALAVGLAGYALWRFVQALADTERNGHDLKGIVTRAGFAVSGVIHAGFAFYAVKLLSHSAGPASGGPRRAVTQAFTFPFGRLGVGIVALVILIFALTVFAKAARLKFLKTLDLSRLTSTLRRRAPTIARLGLGSYAAVLTLIAGSLGLAAWHANPKEARGVGESLGALATQRHGEVMLGVVAAGLATYAAYLFIEARCRRIRVP